MSESRPLGLVEQCQDVLRSAGCRHPKGYQCPQVDDYDNEAEAMELSLEKECLTLLDCPSPY